MRRLAISWESFEEQVIPPDAGLCQRVEMRRAFYAGAWAVLTELMTVDGVLLDAGVEIAGALMRECVAFKESVAGGAG